MAPKTIDQISLEDFNAILSRYPSTVPSNLTSLDTQRYETIPAAIAARKAANEDELITKKEVETLVEWKLKHGTYRPTLLSLLKSNPAPLIQQTTTTAFRNLVPTSPLPALTILTQLKGIGPATASLLLSAYAPESVPFFSDEVFRWCMWEEGGGGWKRGIKYNVKEYEGVVRRVGEVRERLGVRAVEVERVGYVLGREGVDVGGDEVEEMEGGEEKVESVVVEEVKKQGDKKGDKKGVKRKAVEIKPAAEGTRKSSRRRTEE